jgi:hypothetical protein
MMIKMISFRSRPFWAGSLAGGGADGKLVTAMDGARTQACPEFRTTKAIAEKSRKKADGPVETFAPSGFERWCG